MGREQGTGRGALVPGGCITRGSGHPARLSLSTAFSECTDFLSPIRSRAASRPPPHPATKVFSAALPSHTPSTFNSTRERSISVGTMPGPGHAGKLSRSFFLEPLLFLSQAVCRNPSAQPVFQFHSSVQTDVEVLSPLHLSPLLRSPPCAGLEKPY